MAAHTPGPWVFGNWPTGAAGVMPESGWVDVWAPTVSGHGLPFAACKHHDKEANARLISAAPDLLAALQNAEKHLTATSHPNCGQKPGDTLYTVRAAIAKAVQQ